MVTYNDDHDEAPPPSYAQSEGVAASSPASGEPSSPPPVEATRAASPPPPDAQRAIAPVVISKRNAAINETYLVQLTENAKTGPDVDVRSTNGSITAALYLVGTLPRPAEVVIESTNGRVELSVPAREIPLNVRARSTNGAIVASLPSDFDGLVAMRCTNAKTTLSAELKANAILYPNQEGDDDKTTTYLVRPVKHARNTAAPGDTKPPMDPTAGVDVKSNTDDIYSAGGPSQASASTPTTGLAKFEDSEPGPDRAHFSTTNGAVRAQHVGEPPEPSAASRCIVM